VWKVGCGSVYKTDVGELDNDDELQNIDMCRWHS